MACDTRGPAGSTFPILLYHRVVTGADAVRQRFDVDGNTFRRHMDWLIESRRQPLTVSGLAGSLPRPGIARPVAVTFDDGTADFHLRAWPVLEERNIPATLYVTAGLVGRRYLGAKMLSWRQLEELRDSGVEIGAHGFRHIALDLMPLDQAAIELVNSKLTLEDRLGIPVTSFAYPFGYHSEALKHLLQKAGYASACGVKNCLSHGQDDPYALARLTITRYTSGPALRGFLYGRGAPVAWRGRRIRTRLWRAHRYARARFADAVNATQ